MASVVTAEHASTTTAIGIAPIGHLGSRMNVPLDDSIPPSAPLWTSVRTVSFMQRLRRRQVHTKGFVVRQLQSTLEWVQGNKGLTSKRLELACRGRRGNGLTHAAFTGQNGFLEFLNRSDNCRSLIVRRNSDLQRSRPYPGHLSLSVIRENGNFHGCCALWLGLTDGVDHGLIEACTLANILAQTNTDCGNLLITPYCPRQIGCYYRRRNSLALETERIHQQYLALWCW